MLPSLEFRLELVEKFQHVARAAALLGAIRRRQAQKVLGAHVAAVLQ